MPASPSDGDVPRGLSGTCDVWAPSITSPAVDQDDADVDEAANFSQNIEDMLPPAEDADVKVGSEGVGGKPPSPIYHVHDTAQVVRKHEHLFSHATYSPDCPICVKARGQRVRHSKGKMNLGVQPKRFGDSDLLNDMVKTAKTRCFLTQQMRWSCTIALLAGPNARH